MTIQERIQKCSDEISDIQNRLNFIGNQINSLQQQREALVVAYHRADGSLAVLNQMKTEEESQEKSREE